MEEYGLITFKSTQFAIQGESIFKEEEIDFKTIPTPREVSHSCGLALLFAIDDLEDVEALIENKKIEIENLYRYFKEKHRGRAEKII